ncbi:MAG TPA: fumarylacetoacetate hydrolase family protein [Burkholderiaceae bacterium]|nr:fumarylacetoacetate hydrolase family protein [Burkholderiaceae bacterium]
MKLGAWRVGGGTRVAVVENDRPARWLPPAVEDVSDVIDNPALLRASAEPVNGAGTPVAPIQRPRRNIFCVGKNYRDHAREFERSGFDASSGATEIPDAPIFFTKVPECVVGSHEPISYDPAVSTALDYEGELAVIIGTGGRAIPHSSAMDHVWGYTIINDVTARDVQSRLKQWHVGKSFDTFCPMGPWAVTADEINLAQTQLKTWVNGELRQNANTCDLIFDVPTIVAVLSASITLYPGDIIATGTPAGVGIGFKPPRYLKEGDIVAIEIAGLGRLENPVVARAGGVVDPVVARLLAIKSG